MATIQVGNDEDSDETAETDQPDSLNAQAEEDILTGSSSSPESILKDYRNMATIQVGNDEDSDETAETDQPDSLNAQAEEDILTGSSSSPVKSTDMKFDPQTESKEGGKGRNLDGRKKKIVHRNNVAKLREMGYSYSQAIKALKQTNGNIQRAVEELLSNKMDDCRDQIGDNSGGWRRNRQGQKEIELQDLKGTAVHTTTTARQISQPSKQGSVVEMHDVGEQYKRHEYKLRPQHDEKLSKINQTHSQQDQQKQAAKRKRIDDEELSNSLSKKISKLDEQMQIMWKRSMPWQNDIVARQSVKINEIRSEQKRQNNVLQQYEKTLFEIEKFQKQQGEEQIKYTQTLEKHRIILSHTSKLLAQVQKKMGQVNTPDPWKSGARNTTEGGERVINENKALTAKKNRFTSYQTFTKCRICKSSVHQSGSHYCQGCAYKKVASTSEEFKPDYVKQEDFRSGIDNDERSSIVDREFVKERGQMDFMKDELSFLNLKTPFDDNTVGCWRTISSTNECIYDTIDFINCEGVMPHKAIIGNQATCCAPLTKVFSAKSLNSFINTCNCLLSAIKKQGTKYTSCYRHSLRFQISLKIKELNEETVKHDLAKCQSYLETLFKNDHVVPIYHLLHKGFEINDNANHCPVNQQTLDITLLCLQKRILEKENYSVVIVKTELCLLSKFNKIVVLVYFKGTFSGTTNCINGLKVTWKEYHSINNEAKEVLKHEIFENGSLSIDILPSLTRKEARGLFNKHSNLTMISASRWMSVGFSVGKHILIKRTCITLFCKTKNFIPFGESKFPTKIKSHEVDVLEGYCSFGNAVQIGREIGAEGHCKTGTIGGFVELENNEIGVVTCAHALYSFHELVNKNLNPNVNIYTTSKTSPSGSIMKAVFKHSDHTQTSVDAALIKIYRNQPTSSLFPDIDLIQLSKAGFDEKPCFDSGETLPTAQIRDQRVVKYGVASKFTCGKITLDRLHVRIETEGMTVMPTCEIWPPTTANIPESVIMYGQYSVDSTSNNLFFLPGDSGSFVFVVEENRNLQTQTLKCIGMAIGIEKGTGKCIITPIQSVLDALKLENSSELKLKAFNTNPVHNNQNEMSQNLSMNDIMKRLLASSQRLEKDVSDFKKDVNKRLNSLETALRQDTNIDNLPPDNSISGIQETHEESEAPNDDTGNI